MTKLECQPYAGPDGCCSDAERRFDHHQAIYCRRGADGPEKEAM
jgi:hypothetical protein